MQQRVLELDVLRAIAIALALGWHFYTPTGIAVIDGLQWPGMAIGWAGVDLFFVLSGFLVGGLIFGEVQRTEDFNARRFLIRRAFKIWPVLYVYIALVVVTGRYHPLEVVPQTLLHVQNFWTTPISHLWSLAVEEHFYLAFALMAAGFHLTTSNAHKVPPILVGIIVAAPLLRVAAVGQGVDFTTVQIQTQFRADALACGVLLAYLKTFRPDAFASLAARKLLAGLVVAAGVAFLLATRGDRVLTATVGYSVTAVTSAALLLLLTNAFASRGIVARAVAWIGTYSYAMYVFQFVMYRVLEKAWSVLMKTEVPALTLLAMKYGGALLLAVLVTKAIERPSLALRNRLFPAQ